MKPRILIGCECSGRVRDAFAKRGWDAWSCDILPSETPGQHIQDDVLKHLNDGWDMAIFHPPCTRLCNSGVRWLAERNLWEEMRDGAEFFKRILDCKIKLKALENPIPHRYALEIIGRKYDQIVQLWMFGDPETKATCLWLDDLPLLTPTNIVDGRAHNVWLCPPGPERAKMRSRTRPGFADAMAEQWGTLP